MCLMSEFCSIFLEAADLQLNKPKQSVFFSLFHPVTVCASLWLLAAASYSLYFSLEVGGILAWHLRYIMCLKVMVQVQ